LSHVLKHYSHLWAFKHIFQILWRNIYIFRRCVCLQVRTLAHQIYRGICVYLCLESERTKSTKISINSYQCSYDLIIVLSFAIIVIIHYSICVIIYLHIGLFYMWWLYCPFLCNSDRPNSYWKLLITLKHIFTSIRNEVIYQMLCSFHFVRKLRTCYSLI